MLSLRTMSSGQLRAAANVQSEGVVKMLQRRAAAVPDDKIRVGVGFSAAYAMFLHEKKEMKWKGLPRSSLGGYRPGKNLDALQRHNIRELRRDIAFTKLIAGRSSPKERARSAEAIRKEIINQAKDKALVKRAKVIHRGYYWDPQDRAQPNFLVGPFREMREELTGIVRQVYEKKGDMEKALLTAGLRLQREAQQRVPVEFGFLKASAWTRRLS